MNVDKARQIVIRYDKEKSRLDALHEVLVNAKSGKVTSIDFLYQGPSKGMFGQMDDIGEGNYHYSQTVSPKTLLITESSFDFRFKKAIINTLEELHAEQTMIVRSIYKGEHNDKQT